MSTVANPNYKKGFVPFAIAALLVSLIGEERLSTLLNRLIMDGRSAEIQSVVTNAETRKRLYKEYGILPE